MESEFHQSIFSSQFNCMKLNGAWPLDTKNPLKRVLFKIWSFTAAGFVIFLSYMGFLDFLYNVNDFKKLTWNLAVNVIMIGSFLKDIRVFLNSDKINELRRNLYRSLNSCKDSSEIEIFQGTVKTYKNIMKLFHYPFMLFFPLWATESVYIYIIHGGDTPLPAKWLWDVEENNMAMKTLISFFHTICAGTLLFNGMTTDIAMFGILLQISREYEFLLKEIQNLRDYSQDIQEFDKKLKKREVNKTLKNRQIKIKLKEIINHQKDLMKLTDDYERSYNDTMVLQIFLGGTVITINCLQTLSSTLDIQMKTLAQGAFASVILMDIFILCKLGNKISDRCRDVGEAVYDLPWYIMELDLRKDILFIILRSQDPPRISAGRYLDLNMETFCSTMINIYSGMAVLRRIGLS